MPQAIAMAVLKMVIAALVSMALSKLTAKKTKTPPGEGAAGSKVNARSSQKPIPLLYGQGRLPVNWCYAGNSGEDNSYLHLVGIFCEGPIEGFLQVDGVDQLFLDDKIYTQFGTPVYYELFTGTSTQNVCSTLHTAIPEWTDPLRYTAYLYLRLEWDVNKFQNLPNVTASLKGLKIHNPVTDVTEYSRVAGLCTYDYVTRSAKRGGFGIPEARIDVTSVSDTIDYCVAKGWNINQPIEENDSVIDVLSELFNNYRGEIIYGSTKFYFKYRDLNYETVVMAFDKDSMIAKEGGGSLLKVKEPDIFSLPNTINIEYYSEVGNPDGTSTYLKRVYTYSDNAQIESDGTVIPVTIPCLGLSDLDSIQKMANYFLERLRNTKTYSFPVGSIGMALEPHDLITVSSDFTGWSAKISRIIGTAINSSNFTVSLSCTEEFSQFYDDVYDPASIPSYSTLLPDPSAIPSSVINVTHQEEVYYYRSRSFTRWIISFSAPPKTTDPFFSTAKIYLKIGDGDYIYQTNSNNGYQVDPTEEGVTYYLKIISTTIFGVSQADADATIISKTILGKTELPSDMTYLVATASGDTVNIFGSVISDPDVFTYEIRLNSWVGGIFFASNETPNFSRAGIKPGTLALYCKAKDNSGNYSSNFVSTSVEVFYPANYTDKNTWSWDFTTGTFENTEHDTYDGGDVLKCSHDIPSSAGIENLTGVWTSPEYDLGSEKTVKIWGDFLTVFSASSNTWGGIFTAASLWSDFITSTTKWYQLAPADIAGVLTAKLRYGTSPGSYTTEIDGFEILAPEITTRYVQVEVTLIDPNLDANILLKELNMKAAYWQ